MLTAKYVSDVEYCDLLALGQKIAIFFFQKEIQALVPHKQQEESPVSIHEHRRKHNLQTSCKKHLFLFSTNKYLCGLSYRRRKSGGESRRIYIDFGLCFMVIMLLSMECKSMKRNCNQLLAFSILHGQFNPLLAPKATRAILFLCPGLGGGLPQIPDRNRGLHVERPTFHCCSHVTESY